MENLPENFHFYHLLIPPLTFSYFITQLQQIKVSTEVKGSLSFLPLLHWVPSPICSFIFFCLLASLSINSYNSYMYLLKIYALMLPVLKTVPSFFYLLFKNILFPLLNLINFLGSFLTVLDILRDNGASSPKVGFLRRLVQIAHWRQGCFPLSFLFFNFGFIFFSPRKSLRVTKWSWYIL